MPRRIDLSDLRRVAEVAAHKSGDLLRRQFHGPRQISLKDDRDWVTDADFASQGAISEVILEHFPDHGFLSEEENDLPKDGSVLWIVDPLDGTSNYGRQQPNFTISIAAALDSRLKDQHQLNCALSPRYFLAIGVIYDPLRKEMYSAAARQGCTLNGKITNVSTVTQLESAFVSVDWSHQYQNRQALIDALKQWAHRVHTIRALGSAALALAWIAAGRLDLYFNIGVKPWDLAAGKLIISEARGRVSDASGRDWMLDRSECLASNGLLHDRFLRYVGRQG